MGHFLFGIEVFLEYRPLLDLWKKLTHKNVIEKTIINPIINFSTTHLTTSRGVLVSISVVRILFSVAQAVFLDMIHTSHSFGN